MFIAIFLFSLDY